jgi:hypothetical protein
VGRQRSGLRAPQPGQGAQVPTTSRRRPLYRACARDHSQPWFFAARDRVGDPGRFDLRDPAGTSYWALGAATAILEAIADPDQLDPPVLSTDALARLSVWRAERVPSARARLADLTVASVPGLTNEVSTIVPYDLSWSWADAVHAAGRSGILYTARFGMDEAVALFGRAGADEEGPEAGRAPAVAHLAELPAAFRRGIDDVGPLEQLERAPGP